MTTTGPVTCGSHTALLAAAAAYDDNDVHVLSPNTIARY